MDLLRALLVILVIVGGGGTALILGFHYLDTRFLVSTLFLVFTAYFLRDAWLIVFRRRLDKVHDFVGRPYAFPERAAKWRVAALLLIAFGFALSALCLGYFHSDRAAKLALGLFALAAGCILFVAGQRFGVVKKR